ncbi:hypothetical protein [Synechococcus sp. RS9907]|uniref:hypothetical protein n=1 Tax=Synechococcus sp. RS9907 TaxID=221350 RepID=UPI00165EB7AA|nr:hypothetical protein [Synechococcus sp. RS9907]
MRIGVDRQGPTTKGGDAMTGNWVKRLITGVVVATAACAVLLFAGCSTGAWTSDQCDDGQDRAFGVLSGLLTTVMGLAIRLDALDDARQQR